MHNVIVTGGSRGLRLGIARRLTAAGCRVIAIARNENNELTAAMQEAERASPGSFHFVPFDLSDIEGISNLVSALRKDFGAIYVLVNNAGISFDGILALMPTLPNRTASADKSPFPNRAEQVRRAFHDG
jgi:3-oxoacyl-[acyl-carrier protein] reductase